MFCRLNGPSFDLLSTKFLSHFLKQLGGLDVISALTGNFQPIRFVHFTDSRLNFEPE